MQGPCQTKVLSQKVFVQKINSLRIEKKKKKTYQIFIFIDHHHQSPKGLQQDTIL